MDVLESAVRELRLDEDEVEVQFPSIPLEPINDVVWIADEEAVATKLLPR